MPHCRQTRGELLCGSLPCNLFCLRIRRGQGIAASRCVWGGAALLVAVCNTDSGLNPHFHHAHTPLAHTALYSTIYNPSVFHLHSYAPPCTSTLKFTLLYSITMVCGDGLFLLAWCVIRTTVNIIKLHLPDKQPPHFRNVLASYLLPRREGHGSEESRCEVLHPGRNLADDLAPAGHLPCSLPSPGGGRGRGEGRVGS